LDGGEFHRRVNSAAMVTEKENDDDVSYYIEEADQ
jgi:hypothetical protein